MSNTSSGTARDDKLAESIKQIRSEIAQLQAHVAKKDKTINAALALLACISGIIWHFIHLQPNVRTSLLKLRRLFALV